MLAMAVVPGSVMPDGCWVAVADGIIVIVILIIIIIIIIIITIMINYDYSPEYIHNMIRYMSCSAGMLSSSPR